jgi:fluoride exporter
MSHLFKTYCAVMFGGALGTGLRMAVAAWCASRFGESFPMGTLAVNVTGSFAIGLLGVFLSSDGMMRQVVLVGVLGGYTTFSAFSLATLNLLNAGEWMRAGLNVVLSVVLCLVAVWAGFALGTAAQGK